MGEKKFWLYPYTDPIKICDPQAGDWGLYAIPR